MMYLYFYSTGEARSNFQTPGLDFETGRREERIKKRREVGMRKREKGD